MKKILVLPALFAALSLNAFAQVDLPEWATERIGKGAIWEIAYSPDGTRLAVASSIGVWLYDSRTGTELNLLTGHSYAATSVAFSSDGQTLATGGDWPDRTIRLWDAATGAHTRTLIVSEFSGGSLAFSPDGKTLAGETYNKKVRVWNAASGASILTLEGHTSSITSVAFGPNGRTLASGSQDETVRVWDIGTGTQKFKLTAHKNNVTDVAFSPDGRMLASSSLDGRVRLWDTVTGDLQKSLGWHVGAIYCLAFNPDGRSLASGGEDRTISLWDVMTGGNKLTIEGHSSLVRSLAFSPDGQTLASGSWDYTIRQWNTTTGNHKRTIEGHTGKVWSVAFSPDGQMLATGNGNPFPWSANNHIRILDALTGEVERTLTTQRMSWVQRVAYSPDGLTIASSGGRDIPLWDVDTGVQKLTLKGHRRSVHGLAFSPDGQTIATGGDDGTVRLWNAETGNPERKLEGHTAAVKTVAFSPDGRTLASGGGGISLWDVAAGDRLQTLHGHKKWVNSVAFSPDGRMLASGGDDTTVRLWDVPTGKHLHTLEETGSRVRSAVLSVDFSPDGRTLASGNWRNVHVWDVMTGGRKRILEGHSDRVNGVAFSPDGSTLASGSEDGTVLLWEFYPSVNIDATAKVAPATVKSPAVGAEFTIALSVAESENTAGYQATLQFDPTAIRFVENVNGDYFPGGAFAAQPVFEEDRVTVAVTSLGGVSPGGGTLVIFTFEVIAFKESSLTLSEIVLVSPDGERYFPRIENEQVLVELREPTGIVGDVNRDGIVNLHDLVLVGSNLAQTGQNDADVNNDGIVDIVDLVKVAGAFGNGAGAPSVSSESLISVSAADLKHWLDLSRGVDLADESLQRGVRVLENLIAAMIPQETVLLANYPNPFNPETWIPYHLASDSEVMITIYNVHGMLVSRLDVGHQQAGFYTDKGLAAYWDGRSMRDEPVASGTYFYQLHAGDFSAVRRMVIVK